MSGRTKNMLLVIGEHFLFVILSVFLASTFSSLLKHYMFVLSIITGFFYVTSTYSAGWSASKKDFGIAKEEDVFLVKGSRGFKLEEICDYMMRKEEENA